MALAGGVLGRRGRLVCVLSPTRLPRHHGGRWGGAVASLTPPTVHRLDCGLVVVAQPLPHASVTSAHLWFEAGAADEAPEQAGSAHFVEHLLFKGTATRGIGAAAAEIEGLGGDLNAWTSLDETCLHATVADSATELALDVLFDMARGALFDPEELERERSVVLEEIRGYEDDPDGIASDRLAARVFSDHPYGRPVLGTVQTVGSLDREGLISFWRRHYHPERAILIVAGPIEPDLLHTQVEALCRGWRPGAPRAALAPPRAHPGGAELIEGDFGSVVITLGWPTPAANHADGPALDVLAQGLARGASSRLVVRLELGAGVASQLWATNDALRVAGQLSIGFVTGETEAALALTLAELERVAAQGLTPDEVHRARDGLLADLLFVRETTDGLAGELAWATARAGGPGGIG
ncbi:MAG TPA: insulinase family protein, partial [Deltaproteobacteria bacterium]|nr:insulinase family protein [Deltaproteobacteria bacterium]